MIQRFRAWLRSPSPLAYYSPVPISGWRVGLLSLKIAATAPLVIFILWPLTAWNYRQRRLRRAPDKWYWADVLMLRCGWFLMRH